MRIWTIFRDPLDIPGKFVLRGFSVVPGVAEPEPDEKAYASESLEALRNMLPADLVRLPPDATDHETVVESWI
jgi:hypothetical protein